MIPGTLWADVRVGFRNNEYLGTQVGRRFKCPECDRTKDEDHRHQCTVGVASAVIKSVENQILSRNIEDASQNQPEVRRNTYRVDEETEQSQEDDKPVATDQENMYWQHDRPSVPGWYWFKPDCGVGVGSRVVFVCDAPQGTMMDGSKLQVVDTGDRYSLLSRHGLWSGRLIEPSEGPPEL